MVDRTGGVVPAPEGEDFARIASGVSAMTDLTPWLREWPWRPGSLDVRAVVAADGRPLLQIRLEMGILQLEADGRPDGLGYRDAPSALAWWIDRPDARLDAEGVGDLESEMAQRRQRAMACAAMQDWRRVHRDSGENLQALDLIAARAASMEDRRRLEAWRVHEVATRSRAEASIAVAMGRRDLARQALESGLAAVRDACGGAASGGEAQVAMLMGLLDALTLKLPSSERAELEGRLLAAVRSENFELAAILRDELRLLGGHA